MCIDPQQQQQRVERAAGCTPGESWMDECNKCFCTDTGKYQIEHFIETFIYY
jgi:hypothetical protein